MALDLRERRMVVVLGSVVAIIALIALPIGMELVLQSQQAENEALRSALSDVQEARTAVHERQSKKEAIAARYEKRAPALPGFIEDAARKQKLEVTDAMDRPEVPVGKRYMERSTIVKLKKAGMLAISKFFESIEKSGFPVALTRVNIRKRTGEPDSYDVEVGLSAFDRKAEEKAPEPAPDKEKKP